MVSIARFALLAVCFPCLVSGCRSGGVTEPAALKITLPVALREFPEPLPARRNAPGFEVRGIKGWMWSSQQYLAEIPTLTRYKMNFLMNCYTSMCDIEHYRWGDPQCNRWWEPLPEEKRKAYEEVVRACRTSGIQFCFSMNPNLTSRRYADPERFQDVAALWQHYRWMQDLGVKWFSICLDDISKGIEAKMQAKLVNEILRRLRLRDPSVKMIFCPTYYWGDGNLQDSESYLKVLAGELDREIFIFWTGDAVVTPKITRRTAEHYRTAVDHRLFLWDNYPVNDNNPTMNLGPVAGRDSDLCDVVYGYMANSLCPQNEINRLPVATCADYAYNPWGYDPARSIGQAILHLAVSEGERTALAALVESYPGSILLNKWLSFNPVRENFLHLVSLGDGKIRAGAYCSRMDSLLGRFQSSFPDRFLDARKTLADDILWMKGELGGTP